MNNYNRIIVITLIFILAIFLFLIFHIVENREEFDNNDKKDNQHNQNNQEDMSIMKNIKNLGCYRDKGYSLMPDKVDFRIDDNAVEACALYAKGKGWKTFGVQNDGVCTTGSMKPGSEPDYKKLGSCSDCPEGGRGSKGIINIYQWIIEEEAPGAPGAPGAPEGEEKPKPKLSNKYATFYSECDFKGTKLKIPLGEYNKVVNNQVLSAASIKTGPRTVVEIYSEPDFKGKKWKIVNSGCVEDESHECFDKRWNYPIGSIKILSYDDIISKPYATLCTEPNCEGMRLMVPAGKYSIADMNSMEINCSIIKSITLSPYTSIEFYTGENFDGKMLLVTNDKGKVERINQCINEDIKSMIVRFNR